MQGTTVRVLALVALVTGVGTRQGWSQGSLRPPGAPGPTMKALDQVEPRTAITNLPCTISQSGSYYVTRDLTSAGDGRVINADNVTVDLMGFTLHGAQTGNGIYANGRRTVAVRNGAVCGFNGGLWLQDVEQSAFESLNVASNISQGVFVFGLAAPCRGNRFSRCNVSHNGLQGLYLSSSDAAGPCSDNTLEDCTLTANGDAGVFMNGSSGALCDGNRLERCTVSANGGDGVSLFGVSGSCAGNLVKNCVVRGNGGAGLNLQSCQSNHLEGNDATANGTGLVIIGAGNYVAGNTVSGNSANYYLTPGNQLNLLISEIPTTIDWSCTAKLAGTLTCAQTAVDGIRVTADDVTIDLDGHSLVGPGHYFYQGVDAGYGIVSECRNLRVCNGMVTHWGNGKLHSFGGGLDVAYAGIQAGPGAILENVQAASNTVGVFVGNGGRVTGCTVTENSNGGITARDGSTVIGCAVFANGGNGIATGDGSTVCDCSVGGGAGAGIYAYNRATIMRCTASGNAQGGIWVWYGSTVSDCTVGNNTVYGIKVGQGCRVVHNLCYQTQAGMGSVGAGIEAGSGRNTIDGNSVVDNAYGVKSGGGDFIVRNTAHGNGVNWDVAAGSACYVLRAAMNPGAILGDSGGVAPGVNDPNANYTY